MLPCRIDFFKKKSKIQKSQNRGNRKYRFLAQFNEVKGEIADNI